MDIDPDKARQLLEWLEGEDARVRAERIESGELVEVPLYIVGGSETSVRVQVEHAKADKLAELHAAGDQREVVFTVELVVTGVVRPGETADPASVPSAPSFASREDVGIRPPMMSALPTPPPSDEVIEEEAREEPQPPSSRRTSVFKSANAKMMTIRARLSKGISLSMARP